VRRAAAALAAVIASLALLAGLASADEGWVITSFAADISIQRDSSLRIVEAINLDFGALQKHGIFRTIPVRYQWDDTHVRVYELRVRSVTDAAGKGIRYETADAGPFKKIKIGDPDRTVSGRQTYRITYDVAGAMNALPDHDELFWNVNGANWPVASREVAATVHAPGGIGQVACYEGLAGSRAPCRMTSSATTATFAATRALPSGQGLTIVASLAKGTVPEPNPILQLDTSDPGVFLASGPIVPAVAVSILVAGLVLLYWRWYTVGRDARGRQTIVPEYEPPDKRRPAELGLLVDESADTKDVTATIVDLAVRGYLTISELPSSGLFSKKDWTLHKTAVKPTDLALYERTVYDGLFEGRDAVNVSELKQHFIDTLRSAEGQLYQESVGEGWFSRRPDTTRWLYVGFGILAVVVGLALMFLMGSAFGAGLVGLAIAALGVVAMPLARVMPAKTAAGAELLRRALGFRMYMEVAEKDRAKFAERENIFSAYLPYAIVFGCVDKWARAFAGIDTARQTGAWYVGTSPVNAMQLSSSLQGFSSDLGSAIAATAGSSGGSGFSGGAGGGGGGGGGGSW
jgi:uncharacterized protein (TIGR04222 family)